jgi:hypothetical protein
VEAAAIVAAATPEEAHTADAMSSAQTATKRPCKSVREEGLWARERERRRTSAASDTQRKRDRKRETHPECRFFSFSLFFLFFGLFGVILWDRVTGKLIGQEWLRRRSLVYSPFCGFRSRSQTQSHSNTSLFWERGMGKGRRGGGAKWGSKLRS